ncbi:MAG: hypothetical protein ABF274_10480 [Nonlabens sp.]|uniref:hypothetical protein n=1 Tax=Nonlabens sp. TaxID=1888209 RepID=UPI00321BA3C8
MGNKKISLDAFTISETLISMLISALIIGISYFFIATIYDQMKWFSDTSQNTEEFASVSYDLNRKVFEANTIEQNKNFIKLESMADTTRIDKVSNIHTNDHNVFYRSIDTVLMKNRKYLKINFMISHSYGSSSFPCYFEIFE